MYFYKYVMLSATVQLASAIQIRLYDDSKSLNCDDTLGFHVCTNIKPYQCCFSKTKFYTAKAQGLNLNDAFAVFTKTGNNYCGKACNAASGANIICESCNNVLLDGAFVLGQEKKRSNEADGSVETDGIGLWDAALGDHRIFKIGEGVPDRVVTELENALQNQTMIHDLDASVWAYEMK